MCTAIELSSSLFIGEMRRVSRTGNARVPATVRRKLFGGAAADREAIARDFDSQMKELHEESKKRWNFDFGSETPLEGRFQWSPVRTRSSDRASCSTNSQDVPCTREVEKLEAETSSNAKKPCPGLVPENKVKKVQTKLSDFMRSKKKGSTASKSKLSKAKTRRDASAAATTPSATTTA